MIERPLWSWAASNPKAVIGTLKVFLSAIPVKSLKTYGRLDSPKLLQLAWLSLSWTERVVTPGPALASITTYFQALKSKQLPLQATLV